ncbi:tRNA uridine-5-carboxymethylaminomethyl(34) synthesis GTPase MnmE [Stappia taiwanensis]|uniref:tRNA modification GTPase MnmE n=1 Tax=Stappia taiwanensis TaxID=992267 RepID=A0A838XT92_9HYPH|nr:tRNA uridine-5-carboxymethylaminomethyl(34) synthesis GTPase MnmE [Stappia taiwanensis]MBA4612957.1 tRNA uridine-5-carboxymethylaminomethyl(34) synthesis GTPase MnmE [Stappia taiwanensis]
MSRLANETIFALSSGPVPAGVAVIRVSGPKARFACETLTGALPAPRRAALRALRDGLDGEVIDQVLVLWFPGPASFTGEDVVEFHCHGGRAVVTAVLAALARLPGLQPAEAGAFTRRAFDNNRLDLTEVEGLADLIAAETEAQRKLAMRQMSGELGRLYDEWRRRIVRIRALIEADFDFADEEDVPEGVSATIWPEVADLLATLDRHLDRSRGAERVRGGLQVVLLGRPNAGKSSLLNALARRDVAIVTPEAGTTRDLLEVHLDLRGFPVTLIDTAGLRETEGLVEAEGIRRGLARATAADLVLLLCAPEDAAPEMALPAEVTGLTAPVWQVDTKADLADAALEQGAASKGLTPAARHHVSVVAPGGLDGLIDALGDFAEASAGSLADPLATRERHRTHLEACRQALTLSLDDNRPLEIRAEDLRRAADALGRIAGRVGVEDLLDVIFREFCIGK